MNRISTVDRFKTYAKGVQSVADEVVRMVEELIDTQQKLAFAERRLVRAQKANKELRKKIRNRKA